MSQSGNIGVKGANKGDLESQIRARISSLSYLPTTVAVAMKFVELGKDLEAGPDQYCKVISSDPSLSSKLLSLSNSSWFGVRNRVTKLQVAVNLLGLGTVRTLAISYCLTGLHSDLKLSAEESRAFWSASLCKAVMARKVASLSDKKHADEAFTAALFQDFALPVMFVVAREPVWEMLGDVDLDFQARLQKERDLFHLDHAEVGRSIAQKLELPELYVDAVAFHHQHQSLCEFVEHRPLADALHAAALCPHSLNIWNRGDMDQLDAYLRSLGVDDPAQFLKSVEKEFSDVYRYFEQGECPQANLSELMIMATRELADSATQLVGTVHSMMNQSAGNGQDIHQLLNQNQQLEVAAARDSLTGTLNRDGFTRRGADLLAKAGRYGMNMAVVYMDLDNFKKLNDTCGHAAGDKALREVSRIMLETVRQTDLVGRFGGDEFVLLLNDCSRENAHAIVARILSQVSAVSMPASAAGTRVSLTLSAGIVWHNTKDRPAMLDTLIAQADELMYLAKHTGGNQLKAA
jgi:diguanylate cyclase (GGDEF)-like protein